MAESKKLQAVTTQSGAVIFVAVRDTEIKHKSGGHSTGPASDLPAGAEAVGAKEKLADTLSAIGSLIDAAAEIVEKAIARHAPSEIGLELNVGFSGGVNPIPFLVNAEGEAAIKITATWSKADK